VRSWKNRKTAKSLKRMEVEGRKLLQKEGVSAAKAHADQGSSVEKV
jgi:hypothetical protein